jgi:hypothetical protein
MELEPRLVPALPDLTPFTPLGWSGPLVVTNRTGSTLASPFVNTADTAYIDWAVINQGNAAVTVPFHTQLLLDGSVRSTWVTSPPLNPGSYTFVRDFSLGHLTAGLHTLTLFTNSQNEVTESDYTNNRVTVTIAVPLTPALISHAYGFDQIRISGGYPADGRGQTIATIDVGDAPNIFSDLRAFDAYYNIPDPPNFIKLNQFGGTQLPPVDGLFVEETALDIEWAHALAPAANLILYEASLPPPSSQNPQLDLVNNLMTAVQSATHYNGSLGAVTVVSDTFGQVEGTVPGLTAQLEHAYDSYFTTPSGHPGITFLASSGDDGAGPQQNPTPHFQYPEYPSTSPNVVAVGGTSFSTPFDSAGDYVVENGWGHGNMSNRPNGGSGGGFSPFEPLPSYQQSLPSSLTQFGERLTPDVALDADQNTGVSLYDSYDFPSQPWQLDTGTSFAAPAWAALIAIADEARAAANKPSLDGPTQTLPALYQLPNNDYHDITTGNNGYPAGPGYDLVTGRGTPIASRVVGDLWGQPPPRANDDNYNVNANTTLTVNNPANGLLANDTDPLGEPLTVTQYTNPAHGTATVYTDGTFTYRPNNNFTGTDSFTYTILDTGTGYGSTATVHINVVQPLPDLAPYAPSGWSGPLVVTNQAGSTTASALTTGDTAYIDWAVVNQGNAPATASFHTQLLLDGTVVATWVTSPPLNPNNYTFVRDFSLGHLAAGSHTLTLVTNSQNEVTESDYTNNSASVTLTVKQPASITSANNATFTAGTAGSFTVTATGLPTPALSESGTLPAGVSFHDNGNGTATLSGTPAAGTGGLYSLTLTAHNGVGSDATQTFTLTVNQAPAITSAASTAFTVGTAGSFTVTASGFPAPTLSESSGDTLPGGVAFNAATGVLSGTPAAGSVGTYTLHFTAHNSTAPDATQTFTLTVNPGVADHLLFLQQPTNTVAGQAISPAVTVEILDRFNDVLTNDNTDTVTLVLGSNPSGGTLNGTLTRTVVNGVATFADLSINQAASGYTLAANGAGLAAVTSGSFAITPAAADHVLFLQQPTNTVAGQTISPAVTVEILDQFNNVLTNDNTDTVTLVLGSNPSGGTLNGTLTRTVVNGVATFADLSINQAAIGYTLVANGAGLAAITSNGFAINPAAADHLVFLQQPSDTAAGQTIPTVIVAVVDQFGNVVTGDNTDTVTLSLSTNPAGGTLSGTLAVTVINGMATFSDLSIDQPGVGYTLHATVGGGLPDIDSNPFNITM